MSKKNNNIVWQNIGLDPTELEVRNRHKSAILWFTGLPCSGKSTLAKDIQRKLFNAGCHVFILDGDNIRHGLCSDLGFSLKDRKENLRRVACVAKLLADAGLIVIVSFISPTEELRDYARSISSAENFFEIYLNASLEVCESRDVKGNYKKARANLIKDYTGISSPYQPPRNPDLVVETHLFSVDECTAKVLEFLRDAKIIRFADVC